jgi:hypothetical protein
VKVPVLEIRKKCKIMVNGASEKMRQQYKCFEMLYYER